MKYYLDTEFIENGVTIDLISIGLVADDGRTYYAQNKECKFDKASDWVVRNVFPHLIHFSMARAGCRSCGERQFNGGGDKLTGKCIDESCPWRFRFEIRDELKLFCDPEKYGKPEFWGYYADYDWVAFCQLFGTMIELPKGFPMYCRDIKQLSDELGGHRIPKPEVEIHHALSDAEWNKQAHNFLLEIKQNAAS